MLGVIKMSKKLRPELWEETSRGPVLLGSACQNCGRKFFPPRIVCSQCYSDVLMPAKLVGQGAIYSSTKVYVPSPKVKEQPYHIGYVTTDEGVAVPAVFTGAGKYPIGTRVEMVIDVLRMEGEDQVFAYKFKPVPDGGDD